MRMVIESNGSLAVAYLDVVNVFGEIERECIRAALEANPFLRMLIPMFEIDVVRAWQWSAMVLR